MNIIVIGASTGGPKVLMEILSALPVLNAALVIVQHMPPEFDRSFAGSLDGKIKMKVELAEGGSFLETGKVSFAPSRLHLRVVHNMRIDVYSGDKVNFVCPSVDVTMKSLSKNRTGKTVGVVLTGMGNDGASGIAHIKDIGGVTIAQDEKTSIVYGMPKMAAATGKVDFILSKDDIGAKLLELVGSLERR